MSFPTTIIIGAGLSGLVTAYELTKAGKKVIIIDQESRESIGGQAFWSFGGLFFINSPLQRRLGVRDSLTLAKQDWAGTARFDREEDYWPRKWADAYLEFAATKKYKYMRQLGLRFFPIVGWAERGDGCASGHGNSVPRFHITWGTGPAVLKPFIDQALLAEKNGLLEFRFRHRVTGFIRDKQGVLGITGDILKEDNKQRGANSSRDPVHSFSLQAEHIVIASGGIGANLDMVRQNWPVRLGTPPEDMISGVPAYVDGSMLAIAENEGIRLINKDRMWHYTEGIKNWNPIWPNHGIRILPGPSSIWIDANGNRLPAPFFPGFDTLGTLQYLQKTKSPHSWLILNQKIIKKEFALSGSEQNPDLTNKDYKLIIKRIFGKAATGPVEDFKLHGSDFIVAQNLTDLIAGMNRISNHTPLDFNDIKRMLEDRDRQLDNRVCKDIQINYIRQTRKYLGDKLVRTATPNKILKKQNGPLIAVKLHILTRKTLGGIETDLSGRVFDKEGKIINGIYAVGEAAGFGGGGMHGYSALEGTFLGGCIFTGKQTGEYIASLK